MPTFDFITKQGTRESVEAPSAEQAISQAPNIASDSGVQLKTGKEPVAITSQNETDRTNENIKTIQDIQRQREEGEETPAIEEKGQRKDDAIEFDEAQELGLSMADLEFDSNTGTFIPKEDSPLRDDPVFSSIISAGNQAQGDINDIINRYEAVARKSFNSAPSVRNIRDQFNILKNESRKQTASAIKQHQRFGARFGTTRFSPLVATGVIQAEQQAGLAEIERLATQEQSLILEAIDAERNKQFDILDIKLEEAREAQSKIKEVAQAQVQSLLDATDKIREANIKSSRESSILNLVNQGVDDISSIFNLLNFDENGNRVGDVSIDEISSILDSVTGGGVDATGDIKQFQDAKALGIIDENMDFFTFNQRLSGSKRKGDGGDSTSGFDTAEKIVNNNPDLSDPALITKLQKETDLNQSEIDNLIAQRVSTSGAISAVQNAANATVGELLKDEKIVSGKDATNAVTKAREQLSVGDAISFDVTVGVTSADNPIKERKTIVVTEELLKEYNTALDEIDEDRAEELRTKAKK